MTSLLLSILASQALF